MTARLRLSSSNGNWIAPIHDHGKQDTLSSRGRLKMLIMTHDGHTRHAYIDVVGGPSDIRYQVARQLQVKMSDMTETRLNNGLVGFYVTSSVLMAEPYAKQDKHQNIRASRLLNQTIWNTCCFLHYMPHQTRVYGDVQPELLCLPYGQLLMQHVQHVDYAKVPDMPPDEPEPSPLPQQSPKVNDVSPPQPSPILAQSHATRVVHLPDSILQLPTTSRAVSPSLTPTPASTTHKMGNMDNTLDTFCSTQHTENNMPRHSNENNYNTWQDTPLSNAHVYAHLAQDDALPLPPRPPPVSPPTTHIARTAPKVHKARKRGRGQGPYKTYESDESFEDDESKHARRNRVEASPKRQAVDVRRSRRLARKRVDYSDM